MTIATTDVKPTRTQKPKAAIPGIDTPMTYEEYMAGPEEMRRYDIIEGYKLYRMYGSLGKQLPNPTRVHQRIQGRLYIAFSAFEEESKAGQAILPPCDVLIARTPRLRTRQPDLLFISWERLRANPPAEDAAPLNPGPELVVEVLSPSDKRSVLAAKIADYRTAGVRELWAIRAQGKIVEVTAISWEEISVVAEYAIGDMARSVVFPGLTVAVDDVFRE